MRGFNRVFIAGHLGLKPEIRNSTEGRPYTQLRIATNRYAGGANPAQKRTDWFNVNVWGKQAETAAKYLDVGHGVMVEAQLDTYTVETESGGTERRMGLNAIHLEFLQRSRPEAEKL